MLKALDRMLEDGDTEAALRTTTDALREVRQESCRSGGSCEAETAGGAKESPLNFSC